MFALLIDSKKKPEMCGIRSPKRDLPDSLDSIGPVQALVTYWDPCANPRLLGAGEYLYGAGRGAGEALKEASR